MPFFLPSLSFAYENQIAGGKGNDNPGLRLITNFNIPQSPCFIGRRSLAQETRSGVIGRFFQATTRASSGHCLAFRLGLYCLHRGES